MGNAKREGTLRAVMCHGGNPYQPSAFHLLRVLRLLFSNALPGFLDYWIPEKGSNGCGSINPSSMGCSPLCAYDGEVRGLVMTASLMEQQEYTHTVCCFAEHRNALVVKGTSGGNIEHVYKFRRVEVVTRRYKT